MTLRKSQDGATAIEYSLIAGLIALGIVGSLTGTKTSLNQTMSKVSSGLVQSDGSPAAPAVSTWASKTLTSRALGGLNQSSMYYTYEDGSTSFQATQCDQRDMCFRMVNQDKAARVNTIVFADDNGTPNYVRIETFDENGNRIKYEQSSVAPMNNGVPPVYSYTNFTASGGVVNYQNNIAPTQEFLSKVSKSLMDWNYFKADARLR